MDLTTKNDEVVLVQGASAVIISRHNNLSIIQEDCDHLTPLKFGTRYAPSPPCYVTLACHKTEQTAGVQTLSGHGSTKYFKQYT